MGYLSIHQKSVYLIILNATMILRSIGKTFKKNGKELIDFKKRLFKELEDLTYKMDKGLLMETDIINSIRRLEKNFGISFGQAQKPINVVLKYHFYGTCNMDSRIKSILHCPLDSKILKEIGCYLFLPHIDYKKYNEIQNLIATKAQSRLEFDSIWDRQHLTDEGLL